MKIFAIAPLAIFYIVPSPLARLRYELHMLHFSKLTVASFQFLKARLPLLRSILLDFSADTHTWQNTTSCGFGNAPGPGGKTGRLTRPLHYLLENAIVSIQKINRKGTLVTRTMRSHVARVRCASLKSP